MILLMASLWATPPQIAKGNPSHPSIRGTQGDKVRIQSIVESPGLWHDGMIVTPLVNPDAADSVCETMKEASVDRVS
jgi:hypothetical protein